MTVTGLAERAREQRESERVTEQHTRRDGTFVMTFEVKCCGFWTPVSDRKSRCPGCGTTFVIR